MRRGLSSSRMPIAVAVYLPEHYARLLATAEDASGFGAHMLSEQHPRHKQLQQRPPVKARFKKKKRRIR